MAKPAIGGPAPSANNACEQSADSLPLSIHERAVRAFCLLERVEHLLGAVNDTVESAEAFSAGEGRDIVPFLLARIGIFSTMAQEAITAAKSELGAIEKVSLKGEAAHGK